jgi:hypothetical protein
MRWIGTSTQWFIPAFILILVPHAHALKLTKDTVRESTFPHSGSTSATWHDSVSLINTTSDTLSMDVIHFVVPQGKEAHLRIGYKVPYRSSGDVEGIVVQSAQPLRFAFASEKRILPRERIPITGFSMETCIECPTGEGYNPNARQDTIRTYVIFETKVSRDTLVVIGTISATSSGIRFPARPFKSPADNGNKGSRQHHFFNSLGQLESENQSTSGEPLVVKFRIIGEGH